MRTRSLFLAAFAFACLLLGSLPAGAAAARSGANACGIPGYSTLWIDYADGSVSFWQSVFARPGIVGAAANAGIASQLRAHGALSVYWDMYLNNRVGVPSKAADPSTITARADRLFDAAVASTGCSTPWIAENELSGAGLVTPWSASNTQYRENVLLYLQRLAQRGARPFLLVNSTPYTDGTAGDWWRQVSQVADIVREDYFPAPTIWKQGPVLGPRMLRNAFRSSLDDFTALGIPKTKLGIMLGFQTEPGTGGREGLERSAWLQTVKWQGLAARQVAQDTGAATIWSWGWGTWGTRGVDPDKPAAACVYLWTRSPDLCDGPAAAGAGFDTSRNAGLIRLPRGVDCTVGTSQIVESQLPALERLTGDRELAYTLLLERATESRYASVSTADVLAAEKTVILDRFEGSRAAYLAAIAKAGATLSVARGAISDQLRRLKIESTLSVPPPDESAIETFYLAYPDLLARAVQATPAPWWLGGRTSGWALSELAPTRLFELSTGASASVSSLGGSYAVKATGDALPLGVLPLAQARPAIAAALTAFARGAAFEQWSISRQSGALNSATCVRDDLPQPGAVDLSSFMPFLSLAG
jgi:hypothetical protein